MAEYKIRAYKLQPEMIMVYDNPRYNKVIIDVQHGNRDGEIKVYSNYSGDDSEPGVDFFYEDDLITIKWSK